MREKKRRYVSGFLAAALLVCSILLGGCERTPQTKDAAVSRAEIADVVEIPEDGIIKQAQFEAFEGTDRIITFEGEDGDISYQWEYPGRNIHNPQDADLSIEFITEDSKLTQIKEISGKASYAIGMKLKGKGLVTVPTLTVTLPEKWEADTAVFCKEKDGKAMKLCDAEITAQQGSTVLSMKITEVGDTYYVVAGQSKEALEKSQTEAKKQAEKSDETEQKETEETENEEMETPDSQQDGDISIEPESIQESSDESQEAKTHQKKEEALTCTISISCSTILDNMEDLRKGKEEFVPSDGWILAPVEVSFQEGESVFDVLLRECKDRGIHMEHSYTPLYGSEYVEGINQLYEYDCGELSGWMYNVDGWFPNYGCDKYILSDGETIQWVYTCDLGKDVGDNSMWE